MTTLVQRVGELTATTDSQSATSPRWSGTPPQLPFYSEQFPSARRAVSFATEEDELRVMIVETYQDPIGEDW